MDAVKRRQVAGFRLDGKIDRGGATIQDLDLIRPEFTSCALSLTTEVASRSVVRNVRIEDATLRGCTVGPALLDEIEVIGLRTMTMLQLWAPALRHVALRGPIGRVMISHLADASGAAAVNAAFRNANRDHYASIDWALDISEAQADDLDIRGIPADLVRRDPSSQIVLRRANLLVGRWRELALGETWVPYAIEGFVEDGYPDTVLAAHKRDKRQLKSVLRAFEVLRDAGMAE